MKFHRVVRVSEKEGHNRKPVTSFESHLLSHISKYTRVHCKDFSRGESCVRKFSFKSWTFISAEDDFSAPRAAYSARALGFVCLKGIIYED